MTAPDPPSMRLRGLPRGDMIDGVWNRLELWGGAVAERVAFRFGKGIEEAARRGRQLTRRVVRRSGWLHVRREIAEHLTSRAPLPLPEYPSPEAMDPGVCSRARRICEGRYPFESGESLPIGSLSWIAPLAVRATIYEQFLLHILHAAEELHVAWRESGEASYVREAHRLAERWIEECLDEERTHPVWDDHVTAMRALVLSRLWEATRLEGGLRPAYAPRWVETLIRHAEKLADPSLYRPTHNHGVTQAYALLVVASILECDRRAPRWIRTALARLAEQMSLNVAADGLHREHSPYYQFFVLRQFAQASRFAAARGLTLPASFEDRLDTMMDASCDLLRPDGGLPAFGDTRRTSPVTFRSHEATGPGPGAARLRRRLSREAGDSGDSRSGVLMERGGLAVLRGPGGPSGHADTYVPVRLANFATSHLHRDLLTFEYYARGRDWVVDAGGPYAYGDPWRDRYFLTTEAHNTVSVEGLRQGIGSSRVLGFAADSKVTHLDAEHDLFPGVSHRRLLAVLPTGSLLVLDRLHASTPRRFRWIAHLSPDLDASLEGHAARAEAPAASMRLRLIPVDAGGIASRLVRGQEDPPQGWVDTGDARRTPCFTIEWTREGRDVVFGALIAVGPLEGATATIALRGRVFQEPSEVEVIEETGRSVLEVIPAGGARWQGGTHP